MNGRQIRDYAEEHFDNPNRVIQSILMDLIDANGWSYETTFEEAIQTHSIAFTKKIKNYKEYENSQNY